MQRLILVLALAAAASGCAQLNEWSAPAGATGVEEQSPYPTRFRNPSYHTPA